MEKHGRGPSDLVASGIRQTRQVLTDCAASPLSLCFRLSRKSHPDVFNILLQVLDDGVLTDWFPGRRKSTFFFFKKPQKGVDPGVFFWGGKKHFFFFLLPLDQQPLVPKR